ncbi:hypothetical protein C8F04DRAFT_1228713 [Mycena alexandri]|uniref:HMG box domain-containing protein n=1 Tax=Mycena alexandri TaxID=1745969 RepID=A0AAD6X9S6_9AGAR|nr:hypothetical protein C8F04DRAFT_1228713 [Mycena alexandri]
MPAFRGRDTHPARALEVNTVAPRFLTIISPTPRAFTFSDSPFSSRSNTLIEPDLQGLALPTSPVSATPTVSSHNDGYRNPPPLSAYTRILSPVSTHRSTLIRRKSAGVAALEESRPKKGDEDYVKRPDNAFILFRRKCCSDRASVFAPSSMVSGPSSTDAASLAANAPGKKQRQADLSKAISQQWKALSPEDRLHWENLAKEKKREHETLHPNYVYRPQRSGAKNRSTISASDSPSTNSSANQRRKNSTPVAQWVEFVIPTGPKHTRSAEAPTPPRYQAVQIHDVHLPTSGSDSVSMDSDADASLRPILVHRGVGNKNGGFNYIPNFRGAYNFEASLQSSDFLRSMVPPMISPTSSPSSTSGSGHSAPYTLAASSFHPAASPALDGAYPTVGDSPSNGVDAEGHYTSYAYAWAASSPWASAPTMGLAECDFDIGRLPEIGFEFGRTAFPAVSGGNKYPAPYNQEFGFGGVWEPTLGEDWEQLNMHLGERELEMGFNDMRAWRDF